ncbi:hypothetical protein BDW22DRAFT_1432807 [Trametopsis cervina]|nr:hypothetical protein BDW22DRAFT_1432807 [Trametopsis cervina]
MSQDQTTISVLEMTQASSYLEQALNALFVFEYMITLGQEINIWKRRYSLSTALFALTRYSSLAANLQTIFLDYITIPNRQRSATYERSHNAIQQYSIFGRDNYHINSVAAKVDSMLPPHFHIMAVTLLPSVVPILICRFMMNLHDIAPSETISEHGRTWSSIRFVGDMGQTLRVPGEEEDEERWDDELSQDQEQQQEASSSADLPSEIESRAQGHECGGEETTSRSQSAEGVVGEGA